MDDPDAIPSRMRKAKWMWRSIESSEKPEPAGELPLADLVEQKRQEGRDVTRPRNGDKEK